VTPRQKQQAIAGLALIVLGLALYYLEALGPRAIFVLVGGVFLVAYLWRREFGFLVPGCILLGVGAGSLGQRAPGVELSSGLALGLGFVAITVVGLAYERRLRWWPLVPGAALILVGLGVAPELLDAFRRHWPLALVAAGALVLAGALFGKGARPAD